MNALPGIAVVNVTKASDLDIKKPPGSHGATITDRGYKPASVTIKLRIYTEEQWAALIAMMPSLRPPQTGTKPTNPFDISHPVAQFHGVAAVIIEDVTGPDDDSVRGAKVVTFKCVEFFPPPKTSATSTPKTALPDMGHALPTPPTPPSATVTNILAKHGL